MYEFYQKVSGLIIKDAHMTKKNLCYKAGSGFVWSRQKRQRQETSQDKRQKIWLESYRNQILLKSYKNNRL